MTEELRTLIARAIWNYDPENSITPCKGNRFQPIAIPSLALSLEINTVHYGVLADRIIKDAKLGEATK